MEHGERQLAGGSRQPVSHLPSASLGQCAALSFIVKGRDRKSEVRGQQVKWSIRRIVKWL